MTSEFPYTTAGLTESVGFTSRKTLLRHAKRLGLGIDLGGRAGKRYSEADRQKLIESLRPVAPTTPKRKRRAA